MYMTEEQAIEQSWIATLISAVKRKKRRTGMTWDEVELDMGFTQNKLHKRIRLWKNGESGMNLSTAAILYRWVRK